MRRGWKGSHITSLGSRDYSRKKNILCLYRLKVVECSCAENPYIKEWLLKKPNIKGAIGRGCEIASVQALPQEVLMRAGYYVHLFLHSPNESGGHIPTNTIEAACAYIFVI